jgi:hypothetical protein
LISQGASAQPIFGTAVVAGGGTGLASTTAYAVLCGGTSTTAALQPIASVGTSGQVLTSNGAGTLPTFQAGGGSASGSIIGEGRSTSTTAITSTTVLVRTGTTPTTGNSDSIISVTYTPTNSNNVLKFAFTAPVSSSSTAQNSSVLLFQGTTFVTGFNYSWGSTASGLFNFQYYMVAGTTSSTTYNIRSSVSGGTLYYLTQVGTQYFNSATGSAIQFTVTEVLP